MQGTLRLLLVFAAAAVAVPLVPFLAFGTRLDALVLRWLDPLPSPAVLAAVEVGVLAADLLLPVPSSVVATLGGAHLGVAAGTACAWLGMTTGAMLGWWLGRTAGAAALSRLAADERAALADRERRFGPLAIVLARPLPLVAEATAIMAGAAGMGWWRFLLAAGGGNLAVAAVWSVAGALGRQADAFPWVLSAALAVPVALAWLAMRRDLQTPTPPL